MIEVNRSKCVYCGACVAVCPADALRLKDVTIVCDDSCISCGTCEKACPMNAITTLKKK
ncbi:MAG: 4Fe-4S binding protein [Candidatus Micrarchaeota archaeon]